MLLRPSSSPEGAALRLARSRSAGTTVPVVALGRPDKPYLRPGDAIELEIDGLGRQRQIFKAA